MLELHKPWHQGKDFGNEKKEKESKRTRERERKGHLFTLFPHHFPIFSLFLHFPSLFNHFFVLTYHFLFLSFFLIPLSSTCSFFSCVCQSYHPQIMDNNIFDAPSSGVNCSICGNEMVIQLQSNSILQNVKNEHRSQNEHHKKKTEIKNDEHRKHFNMNEKMLQKMDEIFEKMKYLLRTATETASLRWRTSWICSWMHRDLCCGKL